jgi:hypothetical protein
MINNLEEIINQSLTEKEQKLFYDLQSKITAVLDKQISSTTPELPKVPDPLNAVEQKHVTDYHREILIRVITEITTLNDSGYLDNIETREEHMYHIPVPSGCDYTKSLDEFFIVFDTNITNCAKIITKNIK